MSRGTLDTTKLLPFLYINSLKRNGELSLFPKTLRDEKKAWKSIEKLLISTVCVENGF